MIQFSNPLYLRAVGGGGEDAPDAPVAVFAGRSNAGKSSVLNALCGARAARTSGVPGSTAAIQLFRAGGAVLADLPGYGYAARRNSGWRRQIHGFLQNADLFCLVTVIDARRGIGKLDEQWLELAATFNAPLLVLLNKADKLNRQQQQNAVAAAEAEINGGVILFSAVKKTGAAEARKFIAHCAARKK